jgi:chemosensory pili system protein ChpA (sensor histidine kinase/response regulator)
VEVCGQRFSIPSVQVEQAVPKGIGEFTQEAGQWIYRHGTRRLAVHRLGQLAGLFARDDLPLPECEVVIFRHSTELVGLVVDRSLDSRELLVKSPGRYGACVGGVVGLSILGDGGLSVSLDVGQLMSRGQLTGTSAQAALPGKTKVESSVPSVLVVDDAITVRAALLRLIEDAGYRAQSARDGVEAVQALANFRPDIVLTDLEMPNMNGIELTAHIRGRQDLRDVPVFMITSRSQEKHRAMARGAGVSNYFTKPYNDAELLDAIESALERA